MATIDTSKNEPGEQITTAKPNLTIQNLQGVVQNFSGDNLKLQGLEKRNFEPSSITGNMPSSNVKHFPDRTSKADGVPLGWFQNAFFYIGPINYDASKDETLFIEMSAGFEMAAPSRTWSSSNIPSLWPEIQFSLGYADNPNGNFVQTIEGTKRMYRSSIYESASAAYRNISGSCTIAIAFGPAVSSTTPIYIYMQVQDNHYANVVNQFGDTSQILDLNIYSSRMHVRKYKK